MYTISGNLFAGRWTLPPISTDLFCGNANPIGLCLLNILRESSITKSKLRHTLPVGGAPALELVRLHMIGMKKSTTGGSHSTLRAGVFGALFWDRND